MVHEEHSEKGTPFTLNGQPVVAQPGETVLSVAARHGVAIPTLCHHEAVTAYGACRVCVVEVSWGKRSKLVTSCLYMPYENDCVETDSERVHRTRRILLELLLARCPGVQAIRDLAREYDVDPARLSIDEGKKDERCILCGLCVRVCDEVVGQHAIGYASRGMDRSISTPFGDKSGECIGCGACVFVCPTGALHYEDVDGRRVMKELNTELEMAICRRCERPFAPAKQIATVQQRLNLPEDVVMTCPSCRLGGFTRVVEETLGKNCKYEGQMDRIVSLSCTIPGLQRTRS